MKPLELHDQRHLEAAQGWFELGNCIEVPSWRFNHCANAGVDAYDLLEALGTKSHEG